MGALSNMIYVRKALSTIKLLVTPPLFFLLPVYGLGLGLGQPTSALKFVTITDDWYDLVGTQTVPPPVQGPLYAVLGLSILTDIMFVALDPRKNTAWLQTARVLSTVACVVAAVCGELILEHVASNTVNDATAPQTAAFGSCISVLMILLIVPSAYELLVVVDAKTADGD
tara:strand:- start:268 stop:777 length:510 start_codon:yes stop_codon:yes gene_type:complete